MQQSDLREYLVITFTTTMGAYYCLLYTLPTTSGTSFSIAIKVALWSLKLLPHPPNPVLGGEPETIVQIENRILTQ